MRSFETVSRNSTPFSILLFNFYRLLKPEHLEIPKHDSILRILANANPYEKTEIGSVDALLNVAFPAAQKIYQLHLLKKQQEALAANFGTQITESEQENYLNMVV